MQEIIQNFYESFNKLDAESMVAHYHPDIVFEDPAFGVLQGDRAVNMWRMLCETQKKGNDFRVEFSGIKPVGNKWAAHWEAHYEFSKTGRRVHNKIDAVFQFQDGKIVDHRDYFNLHQWAKQAMGFQGALLGGTGFFRKKLNARTNALLTKFEQKQGGS